MEEQAVRELLPTRWRFAVYLILAFIGAVGAAWAASDGDPVATTFAVALAVQGWFASAHVNTSRSVDPVNVEGYLQLATEDELRAELDDRAK